MTITEGIETQVLKTLPQPRARITHGHGPKHQGSHRNKKSKTGATLRVTDTGNWEFL